MKNEKKKKLMQEPFLGYCPNNIVGIVLQGCNCIAIGGCLSGWISITIHHCIVTIVQFWQGLVLQ